VTPELTPEFSNRIQNTYKKFSGVDYADVLLINCIVLRSQYYSRYN